MSDPNGTPEGDWLASSRLKELPKLEWGVIDAPVVVVAPHPDDETLAVGGALYQLSRMSKRVTIIAVTDGEASHPMSRTVTRAALADRRAKERTKALARLGLRDANVIRLREKDGAVSPTTSLVASITRELRSAAWCIAPFRHDGHPDHDAVGEAAARAAAVAQVPFAEYLVWAWHHSRPDSDEIPWERARRLDLLPDAERAKEDAIAAYLSQIAPLSELPGDEAVLGPDFLLHFRRSFEVLLV